MQRWNSSICPKNRSLSLSEVIPYSDTNHYSCSSFSSKSRSCRFIKPSDSTFSQFSHLHISLHLSLPFFRRLHLLVLQPVLQPQTVTSMIDFGAGGNYVMTASYSCISVYHFQPYCSRSCNSGDGICADFDCRAV